MRPSTPRLLWPVSLLLAACIWLAVLAWDWHNEQQRGSRHLLQQAEQYLTHLDVQWQQLAASSQTTTELLLSSPGSNDNTAFGYYAPFVLATNRHFDFLAIVDNIPHAQRTALEREQGRTLRQFNGKQLTEASPRAHYFAIAQQYPEDSKALPPRLDLASQATLQPLLQQAVANGQPVLLQIQAGSLRRLVLLCVPKTRPQPRLLAAGINLEAVLDKIGTQGSAEQQLRLRVTMPAASPPLLFDSHPKLPPPTLPLLSASRMIAGQPLLFELSPVQALLPYRQPLLFSVAFVLALALVALSTHLQLRSGRRRAQLQAQRTQLQEEMQQQLKQQLNDARQQLPPLQHAQERSQAMLTQLRDAVIVFSAQGYVLDINPAAAQLIGQPPASLLHLPAGALVSELHHAPHDSFAAHVTPLLSRPFEAMLICDQAFMLQVELTLSLIQPAQSAPCYLAIARNIAARKEREAALIRLKDSLTEQVENQSRRLSALLDASPMAMSYIVDRHFKQVNKAFLELFLRQEDEVIEQSTRLLYDSDEHHLRTGRNIYPTLNMGHVSQDEIRLLRGDNQPLWIRMYGRAVKPGKPELGSVWLYQDTSAQRSTEEALRRARDLAEENSRAKTEFLANMSHELRTPLHAVLGFAEMGQNRAQQEQGSKLGHYFERIHSSGSRLLSLLNDLLDLSKMEVGRMEYQRAPADLAQVIRDCQEELKVLAGKSALTVQFDPPPAPVIVVMDAFRIGQVVRNLLSNAIKFSPHGSRISISLAVPLAQLDAVTVEVRDHGPGVPEQERERIFDKFMQSSLTKTGAGGTGLGLAISREIVSAHHGTINVRNAADGGAIFSFTLPRGQSTPDKEHSP